MMIVGVLIVGILRMVGVWMLVIIWLRRMLMARSKLTGWIKERGRLKMFGVVDQPLYLLVVVGYISSAKSLELLNLDFPTLLERQVHLLPQLTSFAEMVR
jgi:hypothetical protein